MLTRNDATVENAFDLIEIARPLGLKHIGFKDVGADAAMLKRLTEVIRLAGASVWMEVVSTAREDELRSVALARDLGVDWLMGGVHAEEGRVHPGGDARRAICRSLAGHTAIRPGSAARPTKSRRIAAPSRSKAAPASTFSPIAPPRPSRSTSSPPAGADLPARAWLWSQGRSIRPSGSPPSAPPAQTPSPSAPRRSSALTRRARGRSRRS